MCVCVRVRARGGGGGGVCGGAFMGMKISKKPIN